MKVFLIFLVAFAGFSDVGASPVNSNCKAQVDNFIKCSYKLREKYSSIKDYDFQAENEFKDCVGEESACPAVNILWEYRKTKIEVLREFEKIKSCSESAEYRSAKTNCQLSEGRCIHEAFFVCVIDNLSKGSGCTEADLEVYQKMMPTMLQLCTLKEKKKYLY